MQFLFPNILYGLFLALIPLILHLINLRKHKRMYFSSLWFLKNLKQQTSRSKKIYEWILLIIRTILIAAIVVAFAGPIIQKSTRKKGTQMHLILDNTLSMQNSNDKGNLYDQVKNKALEIVNNLESNSLVNIHFTATGESNFNTNLNDAKNLIQSSRLQHGYTTINKIARRINERSRENHLIVLSDFQTNIISNDTLFNDTLLSTSLVIYRGENSNISVDSIWFDKPVHIPNEETEISVLLKNHSASPATDVPIQLFLNNEMASVGSESIEANASYVFKTKLQFNNTGLLKIKAEIQDLPINFDNYYYTGVFINSQYEILEIADTASKYLKTLFNEKERFIFSSKQKNQISLSDIQNANTIIVNQSINLSSGIVSAINKSVQEGTNLIIIPNQYQQLNALNELLQGFNTPELTEKTVEKTEIKQVNLNHPIYNEAISRVDKNTKFPEINQYYKVDANNSFNPLLLNDFKEPLLLHAESGNGNIYLFTFNPLEKTFALDPIFIPTMYNASVIKSRNIIPHLQCTYPGTFSTGTIVNPDQNPIYIGIDRNAFIPFYYAKQQNTIISIRKNQIKEPGYYPVIRQDTIINHLAVNHINIESQLNFHDEDYLQNNIFINRTGTVFSANESSESILQPNQKLWKWFILLAVLMILSETLMLILRKRV